MSKANALRTPDVHIVLDTNALYTETVDRLVSKELSEFVVSEISLLGLAVHWHLPAMVISERKQQMLNKASTLLEGVQKLEALLDHKLGFTYETLKLHVNETVRRQMESHGMSELPLDSKAVQWDNIIDQAAQRIPPFTVGAKEKGFKDAVILETFLQLAVGLPRTPSACRIFFLTGDGALGEAIKARIGALKNTRILSDLDDLRTELNAIAAHLNPDAIEKLVSKAKILFFNDKTKEGLYYKWNILLEIDKIYGSIASERPDGFNLPVVKMNYVAPPTFLRKEGQKVFFSSKITRAMIAKKRVLREGGSTSRGGELSENALAKLSFRKWSDSALSGSNPMTRGLLDPSLWDNYDEVEISGSHVFEVHWAATLNRQGRLISAGMTQIEHVSSKWEGP